MLTKFQIEDTVITTKDIRNDGTFPGYERGQIIINRGEKGIVIDHGYFLQDILIYSVYFENGLIVGCLEREMEFIEKKEDVV